MEKKSYKPLPFDTDFVLGMDMPNAKRYNSGSKDELNLDCPLCGKQKKLYINRVKGLFYCQNANCVGHEGGGIVRFHQLLTGLPSYKAAFKSIMNVVNGLNTVDRNTIIERSKKLASISENQNEMNAANIETRNLVYHRMFDGLTLASIDRADLLKRGLTDDAIKKYNIKSTPILSNNIARTMLNGNYNFYVISYSKYGSNIPGLYYCNNEIKMVNLKAGILIPVLDRNGRIAMCQIRRRPLPENATAAQRESYHKYSQLSSSWKETGCSTNGIVKIHHIGFKFESGGLPTRQTPEQVCLTEGCLKADVASFLGNDEAYIAVLGVNNLKSLPDEFAWLFSRGTKAIRIRFDMDFIENPAVATAFYDVNKMLQEQNAISVVFEPRAKALVPCYKSFREIMQGSKEKNRVPLKYFVVHNDNELKKLRESGRRLVFNDFWDPQYKGIDDYMLHCSETFKK